MGSPMWGTAAHDRSAGKREPGRESREEGATMGLEGKVALVTGASRGIGRAIALLLAARGAHVGVNFFRNREAAEQTAREIEALGVRALVLRGNVGDEAH